MATMKGVVKFDKTRAGMELRELPKPTPPEGWLLVKVMAAGICGTDLHIMDDEYAYEPPVVLGHEYTGIIEEVGKGVKGFKEGDQVISMSAAVTCNECDYCKKGIYMCCSEKKSIGSGVNGAMADYVIVPADRAFKIPKNAMKFKEALAVTEPAACVIRAVLEMTPVRAGKVALVSGPGLLGQMAVQLLKLSGMFVIVSGLPADQKRLDLAKKLGADVIVNDPAKLHDTVYDIAPYGCDIVYEVSGAEPSWHACYDAVKKTGHFSQIGLFGKPIPILPELLLMKELTLTGNNAQAYSSWEILIKLLEQEKLDLSPFAQDTVGLSEWEKGFDMAIKKECYKALLIPGK